MTSSYFPLPIDGRWSDDELHFILDTPFVYHDLEQDLHVEIPAGFETDFNSVPRLIWGYFPPWQYIKAGLVHDALYKEPWNYSRPSGDSAPQALTRGDCDDVHRRILDLEGCRWSKRQTIWLALRVGGQAAWNEHRAQDHNQ